MLNWKTDWSAADNYARKGVADVERLINNYIILAARIKKRYWLNVGLEEIVLYGYATVPYADFLNKIERNLVKLYSPSQLPNAPDQATWEPGKPAPTHWDINRWESSGRAIDEVIDELPKGIEFKAEMNITDIVLLDGVLKLPAPAQGNMTQLRISGRSIDKVIDGPTGELPDGIVFEAGMNLTDVILHDGVLNQADGRIEASYLFDSPVGRVEASYLYELPFGFVINANMNLVDIILYDGIFNQIDERIEASYIN